ncbi:carbohydrate ABC transporter permease [Jiangella sp. DSM 45060]|uniref:carbohydrate ABC transporter permease n=1 Tax=Jiangella sp. DSM 45060 TaxID=1798224 RepID=UPI00087BCE16|nr:sugar ABC transporter permease [Jiangella sp. DSM 45060]SDT72622.1 alpha-glucoside transport system permease protein [Jiangella sp. DSM 45060]
MIADRIVLTLAATAVILVGGWAYLRLGDRALAALPRGAYRRLAPWLFAGPAVAMVLLALAFPAVVTVGWSFVDDGGGFAGFANYAQTLSDEVTRVALRNTVLWVVLLPTLAVLVGLAIAVLAERVRYGALVKAALFLPIAISAVAAGVIWSFMYDYQPPGAAQTATLNAVVTALGGEPVAWIVDTATNNYALIGATLWTQAGFAMVIFGAALRAVPDELLEAARLDGASEWKAFRHVTLPFLAPTVVVVATTMTVTALKAFDIVYVMTNGNYGTDVLSTVMYRALFTAKDNGLAGAVATILMLTVVPIMVLNVRQFRRETGAA